MSTCASAATSPTSGARTGTSSFARPTPSTLETEIDITFAEAEGGTMMTVVQTGFPTEELRDFFSTYAWVGAFDRITAFLQRATS
jgi:hypothetical protein